MKTVEDVKDSMRETSLKIMFGYDKAQIEKVVLDCCNLFSVFKYDSNTNTAILNMISNTIKDKIQNIPTVISYPFQINVDVKDGYTYCDLKVTVEFLIDHGDGLSLREEVVVKYNRPDVLQNKESLQDFYSAYYGSEQYLNNTKAWNDLPEKTEIQCGGPFSMVDMVSQESYDYEINTKQVVKQEEPKFSLPKYSEFESNWEPQVNIENTTTNQNYREHITNLIHKVTHEQSWCFLDRTQRLEKLGALISLYMESFQDFEFSEITDEDSSLLHDYIYNVSIVNTKNNVCETIKVTGRFETEKNKCSILDLEYNWLVQEEIPLSAPVKSAYTYDGSDTKYNAYCRVKKLYSGYGCGQPNEKIEIEPKENTNYPAFLTKTDMSILRILTSVYLLSGEIIYDNYVCEQAKQLLPDKKCKIVRKEKLVDTYFYISNQTESVWAKVFVLELLKPTIEKPVTRTVNIDYEQLQILIKSYNDNGGNITYDYSMDRLVEQLAQKK